jgi:hypothetical protein
MVRIGLPKHTSDRAFGCAKERSDICLEGKGVTKVASMPQSLGRAVIHLMSLNVMFSPFRARLSCFSDHTRGDAPGWYVIAPSGRNSKKRNIKTGASG